MRRRLDPGTLLVIVLAAVGSTRAAAAPFAYIACQGGGVAVIDTATDTVTTTITAGSRPNGVAVGPGSSRVYVSNEAGDTVSFIDTATNAVVATASVGDVPFTLDVDPTGARLYVGNASDNTVSVVDAATGAILDTIHLPGDIYGVAAHPVGTKVYVVNPVLDQLSVIDTATDNVIGKIAVGDHPDGIAIDPAGTRVYVANQTDDTVSVIDATTDLVIDTIPVGHVPVGIGIAPDGSTVYVSNNSASTVSVIDAATDTVVATIPVGGAPFGVSVHPDGSKVYVPNSGSNNVSVIAAATNTELYRVAVCSTPIAVGRFITGATPAATVATAATGYMSVFRSTLPFPELPGTLDFEAGSFGVFGTPVDIRSALGGVPMDLIIQFLAGLPGGYRISLNATSSSLPTFSLSGTGYAMLSGQGLFLTIPLSPPTGTALAAGPIYTLVADLTYGPAPGVAFAGPFTLGAALAANTPEGTDVNVPVTTTIDLCPGASSVELRVNVEFSEVTAAGGTLVSAACRTPASIPPNIALDVGSLQLFFDVSTTASYNPPITICVGYPDEDQDGFVDGMGVDELTLRLLHDESGGNFQPPVDQSVDPLLNRVCAEVDHLSPFLLAAERAQKGFVAPDDDARKCENKLLKLTANLVKAIVKCNRKAAEAAFKSRSFDFAACETDARAKYDEKVAALGPCPACVSANASSLGDSTQNVARGLNGAVYCEGTTTLPGDTLGLVPTSDGAVACGKRQGRNVAKLTKKLGKCYRKLADGAFKGRAVDTGACLAEAGAGFDAASSALDGCDACTVADEPGLRNQVERFAVEILSEVYCAGTTPLP
jgi:YVTN family beta-propeller protein